MDFDIEYIISYLENKKAVPEQIRDECFGELRKSGKFNSHIFKVSISKFGDVLKDSSEYDEVELRYGHWGPRTGGGKTAIFKVKEKKLVLVKESGFFA